MGLAASQARFLQLTARKSNIEYQAQQINFERLQWAEKLTAMSTEYQDKVSNRKLVFKYNNGEGLAQVDVTYQNYKNYMNQQLDGLVTSHDKMFLVSSSGNKIIVSSEAERDAMIEQYSTYTPIVDQSKLKPDKDGKMPDTIIRPDAEGMEKHYLVNRQFNENDFMIVDDLDDNDLFQDSIKNGVYFFAELGMNTETSENEFKREPWESIGGGAISEDYDVSDDAEAEAKFKAQNDKIQLIDKKLELQLNKLETERNAIKTEMDSISSVIKDNVTESFKLLS